MRSKNTPDCFRLKKSPESDFGLPKSGFEFVRGLLNS